jgi:DNA-binding NtrC family response regulator
MEKLNNYEWPGNIRQLEHEIERATILARGGVITSEHLSLTPAGRSALQVDVAARLREGASLAALVADVERLALQEALAQHDNNHDATARALELTTAEFNKKLKTYNLG